jgi:hypothetical protein
MRPFLGAVIVAGFLAPTTIALAQSSTAPAAAAPAPSSPSAAAVPVQGGKRLACQSASQRVKGQERRDQMQLCMMQARLDCLKQAIDQKIVGTQRKDFMKSCAR